MQLVIQWRNEGSLLARLPDRAGSDVPPPRLIPVPVSMLTQHPDFLHSEVNVLVGLGLGQLVLGRLAVVGTCLVVV